MRPIHRVGPIANFTRSALSALLILAVSAFPTARSCASLRRLRTTNNKDGHIYFEETEIARRNLSG